MTQKGEARDSRPGGPRRWHYVLVCLVAPGRGLTRLWRWARGARPPIWVWGLVAGGSFLFVVLVLRRVFWWGYHLPPDGLQKWANLAQLLQGVVGLLTLGPVLWAILRYRRASEDQRKARLHQAWQAITLAQGRPGSLGRIEALQDLARHGVSLAGVNLTGDGLKGAYLRKLDLRAGADLEGAIFHNALLKGARMPKARLRWANLEGAQLQRAILREADLEVANLQRASLVRADLRGASLLGARLQGAFLSMADLSTAIGLTREQILSANNWDGAKLPPDLEDLELHENAMKLGQNLE